MNASYSQQPQALEYLPDGYHKYRYDIQQITDGENTQWTCNEVIIRGAVTSNKITEVAIAEKWGNGVEQKLINDYMEYSLGIGTEESKIAYETFLAERKALKEAIKAIVND